MSNIIFIILDHFYNCIFFLWKWCFLCPICVIFGSIRAGFNFYKYDFKYFIERPHYSYYDLYLYNWYYPLRDLYSVTKDLLVIGLKGCKVGRFYLDTLYQNYSFDQASIIKDMVFKCLKDFRENGFKRVYWGHEETYPKQVGEDFYFNERAPIAREILDCYHYITECRAELIEFYRTNIDKLKKDFFTHLVTKYKNVYTIDALEKMYEQVEDTCQKYVNSATYDVHSYFIEDFIETLIEEKDNEVLTRIIKIRSWLVD